MSAKPTDSQWEAIESVNADIVMHEPNGRDGPHGSSFRVRGISWDENGDAHFVADLLIDPFGHVVQRGSGDDCKGARI